MASRVATSAEQDEAEQEDERDCCDDVEPGQRKVRQWEKPKNGSMSESFGQGLTCSAVTKTSCRWVSA